MLLLFIASTGGIILYPLLAGTLLILSLIIFGTLTLIWKEPQIKIAGLIMLVLLALANIGINGMKYGIDFSGGTRIPVVLEKSVDQTTMNELVQTIKKRVSVLGLTEAKVRAIGDSEINVEIPNNDPRPRQHRGPRPMRCPPTRSRPPPRLRMTSSARASRRWRGTGHLRNRPSMRCRTS